LFELVQQEWDDMEIIGITHSQQTQKDVSHSTNILFEQMYKLCLISLLAGNGCLPPPPKPHPLQFENGSNIVRQFSYSTLFFIIYIIRNMEYCLTVELFKTANRMLSMTCDHIGMYFFYINFSTGLCNNLFKLE
jgi:hypothetical protein